MHEGSDLDVISRSTNLAQAIDNSILVAGLVLYIMLTQYNYRKSEKAEIVLKDGNGGKNTKLKGGNVGKGGKDENAEKCD